MSSSAAVVSLDNPVRIGQTLWRLLPCRRCTSSFNLQRGTVTELNWHYYKVTPEPAVWCHPCWHRPEWLDAREVSAAWSRNLPQAVERLAWQQGRSIPWHLLTAVGDQGAKRPCQWARFFKNRPHPRSIAAAFRWLASFGLASRTGGRRGRWRITLTPAP